MALVWPRLHGFRSLGTLFAAALLVLALSLASTPGGAGALPLVDPPQRVAIEQGSGEHETGVKGKGNCLTHAQCWILIPSALPWAAQMERGKRAMPHSDLSLSVWRFFPPERPPRTRNRSTV